VSACRASRTRTVAFSAKRSNGWSGSILRSFPEDFVSELEHPQPVEPVPMPKIVDIRDGIVTYDESQLRKQPDWTYTPA